LQAKPIPGQPARLLVQQRTKLEQLLLRGPLAAGYPTELSVCSIAEKISSGVCVLAKMVGSLRSCRRPRFGTRVCVVTIGMGPA
jgi:hypothetical protein